MASVSWAGPDSMSGRFDTTVWHSEVWLFSARRIPLRWFRQPMPACRHGPRALHGMANPRRKGRRAVPQWGARPGGSEKSSFAMDLVKETTFWGGGWGVGGGRKFVL